MSSIVVNNENIETGMAAVYALKSNARMAQELMELIVPTSRNQHNAKKCVPVYLYTSRLSNWVLNHKIKGMPVREKLMDKI
eukprot:12402801-Ditylum_brightwellii.AAC.1